MTCDDESAIKEEKKQLREKIKKSFNLECNIEIVHTARTLQSDASYCKTFLEGLYFYKDAKTVFGYVSTDVEFPTSQLLKQVLKDGKILALPRVDGKYLQFCQVKLEGENLSPLQKGAFGIIEPKDSAPILFDQRSKSTSEKAEDLLPLLVLVPGRAFTLDGARLGYGGGFYDRFFSALFASVARSSVFLAGLCFSFQVLPHLPTDVHDVLVDKVLTLNESL